MRLRRRLEATPAQGAGRRWAPEDSFLSRQIVSHPHRDPQIFFDQFADRIWNSGSYSSGLHASALRHKVRVDAVRPIFESMVGLSDHGKLLERFLVLPLPTLFMHGHQNNALSYLTRLAEDGIDVAEISHSPHFPMCSNAPEMWSRITDSVVRNSNGDEHRDVMS